MMLRTSLVTMLVLGLAAPVAAQSEDASASGQISLGGGSTSASSSAALPDDGGGAQPEYGPPWRTEPGMWELGMAWGLFFPPSKHELFDADGSTTQFHELETVTPDLGLRGAWYPLSFLGLEIEANLMPSQTKDTGAGLNIWATRGHIALLAPTKTIVPFLVLGGGVLGLSSEQSVLGNDVDGSLHAGVGLKAFIGKKVAVRLDVRDNISGGLGDEHGQYWEALIGVSVVGGRAEPPPPPLDTDGDGVPDSADKCPTVPGAAPDGCVPPPPDSDGDGVTDDLDKCPQQAGVASSDPTLNGCPPPPPADADGDGVPDKDDQCPEVKGDSPNGCIGDSDNDGLLNNVDKCPGEAETKNGFEDDDGCPDEIPETVKKFTGAIKGISFKVNSADITAASFPTLDAAAKVMTDYPSVRMEISGHTDDRGKPERNQELSQLRAESVKAYMVGHGVAGDRIVTRGAGPNEPVADNKTKAGREQNRRIEFKLLQNQ